MANHVYAHLDIEFENHEDVTKFSNWLNYQSTNKDITYGERVELCCNTLLNNLYPDKEDTRVYYIENLGAKWIYFDDVDIYDTTVNITWTTAWDFPEKLFNKLSEYLQSQYKNFTCSCTFEDESFNFIGVAVANEKYLDWEYYEPDNELKEYRDEDDCLTDEFFGIMIDRKDEMLREIHASINITDNE